MRLWVDTEGVHSSGKAVRAKVGEMTANVNRQVVSRATRSLNALRNAELDVLKGQRNGENHYRKPYTKEKKKNYYQASAPGEPPARRTGALRLHWNGNIRSAAASGNGVKVIASLESQEHYAGYLEHGTSKMEPRPFLERIIDKATPEVVKIYNEHYL